jgi:hypothetical protein
MATVGWRVKKCCQVHESVNKVRDLARFVHDLWHDFVALALF